MADYLIVLRELAEKIELDSKTYPGSIYAQDAAARVAAIRAVLAEVEQLSTCVHCGERMGINDDACASCYSTEKTKVDMLDGEIEQLRKDVQRWGCLAQDRGREIEQLTLRVEEAERDCIEADHEWALLWERWLEQAEVVKVLHDQVACLNGPRMWR